jgi:hypothetical protein
MFVAFGLLAGGSCAAFLHRPSGPAADLFSILFFLTVPLAAGALTLLAFRLWRRRAAEAWPSLLQCVLMGMAGGVLAIGGCGGWVLTMDDTTLLPIAMPMAALFVAGLAFGMGAIELFAVGVVRLMLRRPGAR